MLICRATLSKSMKTVRWILADISPIMNELENLKTDISVDAKVNKKDLNWAELGFQYVKTDFRFSANWENGEWDNGELIQDEIIPIHEGAPAIHYAQQCFEGLKAQTSVDGRVLLFRPDLNCERMNRTAPRILMPQIPEELFTRAIDEVVRANYPWIPPYGSGASLYIRPMLIGVGENLGLKPAQKFEFRVFVSPVGPYYKSAGLAVISLAVSDFDRAAPSGTGSYKVGANYAGGLMATSKAQELGASEALYLDAGEKCYIDEAGSANIIIATKDGSLITPKSDAILPSITRKSLMILGKDKLGLNVEERSIDLREEFSTFEEAAACGTAAVLSPVGKIFFDDDWHRIFGDGETVGPVMQSLYDQLVGIQKGEIEEDYGWIKEVSI
jgi:branched-chain amino acid aminotransferase